MRTNTRAIGAVLACIVFLACAETAQRTDFEVPGLYPAALISPQGAAHVVYVDGKPYVRVIDALPRLALISTKG